MRLKNILLVLVMIVGMIGLVPAVFADSNLNANITAVTEAAVILPITNMYHLNNGTYLFNLTVDNLNTSVNVTSVNITLDSAFKFVDGTNISDNNISFSNTSNILMWSSNSDYFVLNYTAPGNTSCFVFNATINQAASLDGTYNFTVSVGYNSIKSVVTYSIENVTVDNTAPILASAVTHNTTGAINITFTEANGIKGSTVIGGDMNITGNSSANLNVSRVEDRSVNNKTFTVFTPIISTNETPTIDLNTTHITDWAGNNVSTTFTTITASDRIRPSLQSVGLEYNDTSRNLTLVFDEPMGSLVYPAGIFLRHNTSNVTVQLSDANISAYQVYARGTNKTVIQVSTEIRDVIRGWKPVTVDLNVSLELSACNDSSNNAVNAVANQTTNTFVRDTTPPYLIGAYYTHSTRKLNLTFSEIIDVEFASGNYSFIIGNQTDLSNVNTSQQIMISTNPTAYNSSSVEFTLTAAEAANLSSWRVSTLYIYVNNITGFSPYSNTFPDLVGNNVTEAMANSSARGYINASTYTNDTTAPYIITAIVLNDTSPTRAGTVNFSVTFNEYMDRSTSIVVKLQPNTTSSSYTIGAGYWINYTEWVGNYSIGGDWRNSPGDGLSIINVTGARDVAYNAMIENHTNEVLIDTTPPTLVMAWYNDTGFDYNESTGLGTGGVTDFLVLKFSENITLVNENGSTSIYLANSSSLSNAFIANASPAQGAIFVRQADYRKIKAAINESAPPIWVRGIYNGVDKYTGVVLKNGSTSIVDEAGNTLSNSTGPVDLYDNVISLTANTSGVVAWTGFSIPHDFTSTAMVSALSSYTGTIYTHNGSAWSLTTTSNLIPLRSYMIKITGMKTNDTIDLPIQVPHFGGANPDISYTTSVNIKDGAWSLVGVDGYDDNVFTDLTNSSQWLAGLNVPSNSLGLRDSATTSTIIEVGKAGVNTIQPYRAYWLWVPSQTNQPYAFSGYGRW